MLVPHTGQHGACVEDDLCLTGDLQEKKKEKNSHQLAKRVLYSVLSTTVYEETVNIEATTSSKITDK